MKRIATLLWPVLVGTVALAVTGWLWRHEHQTQEQDLRNNFDFGVRQTATRVEQRVSSFEQMLRGTRGLFEASDDVSREDFATYIDMLLAGADFAGLRAIAHAPLLTPDRLEAHVAVQRRSSAPGYTVTPGGQRDRYAPTTYVAPASAELLATLGDDALADPVRRAAMLRAGDSGGIAATERIPPAAGEDGGPGAAFLLYMPLYGKGQAIDNVAARRAHLSGWVWANFRIADLMSTLYGEDTPGLDVQIHDGVDISDATLIFSSSAQATTPRPARYEAQEYIGFAGRTWTLSVRSSPEFELRYSSDTGQVIAIAGTGLSLLLAVLTWQLVTGRERAHAAARLMTRQLSDSAERHRRIVETASEGIWMVDAQARTSFVNPKMRDMLGHGEDDLLGRPWIDFMHEADHPAMGPDGLAQLRPGQVAQREVRFRRRDGTDLWAALSTSPILDETGRWAGALAMVTDVSDRKQAEASRAALEAQLRQSQKMEAIGTLAGGIAHDFNNILAAILGNVALVKQDLGADHASMARLAQIDSAATRARSLVHQIVAFSRQQPQTLVNQPLRPLLEESVRLLRATLPALVELELRFADETLHVAADETQLQQVVMNLCTNAWHALRGSTGRIVIGLDAVVLDAEAASRLGGVAAGRHAHLWVSDNGCGMDDATRLRIFEPFYTTKPVGQGTGLGLSVVHGIVSSHGGAIAVHSVPGQGSTFDIYLPLVEATAASAEPPVETGETPLGQGQQVLYVDDDPVVVLMVNALLRRAGYRITSVGDPKQALAMVAAPDSAFELVITDFNMPELSGLDLARELGRVRPGLPVIITSGYISDTLRQDALGAGVRHVLQKEYTVDQLGALVHAALARR